MRLLASVKTYTLYQRGPAWYVNFRHDGTQYRLSTQETDIDLARAVVESFRNFAVPAAQRIPARHLERMMERARARAKKKGIPFELGRESMAALADRAEGRCEVTGHALEVEGPFRPSLDRIDCTLGYIPGNVRIVCLITNTAMLHYGEAAFLELAVTACKNRGLI